MKNRLQGKTAIITGATSGIGESVALQLADLGVNLILTGRRSERLETLKTKIFEKAEVSVDAFVFDMSDPQAIRDFVEKISGLAIDILINNAGLASGYDKTQDGHLDDWDIMVDVNVRGLMHLTRHVVPGMIARNKGHILNVSSIAGHEAYPRGAVYCATKHAVRAFTEGLKMDLGETDIRVGMVSPGAVNTEFSKVRFKGNQELADKVYAGIDPLIAQDIAEIVVFMLNRPDHVNILDTIVMPVAQSSTTVMHRRGQ